MKTNPGKDVIRDTILTQFGSLWTKHNIITLYLETIDRVLILYHNTKDLLRH